MCFSHAHPVFFVWGASVFSGVQCPSEQFCSGLKTTGARTESISAGPKLVLILLPVPHKREAEPASYQRRLKRLVKRLGPAGQPRHLGI
jgi:hypothetical protein